MCEVKISLSVVQIYVRISAMVTVIVDMKALGILLIVLQRHLIRACVGIILMDVIAVLVNQMAKLSVL